MCFACSPDGTVQKPAVCCWKVGLPANVMCAGLRPQNRFNKESLHILLSSKGAYHCDMMLSHLTAKSLLFKTVCSNVYDRRLCLAELIGPQQCHHYSSEATSRINVTFLLLHSKLWRTCGAGLVASDLTVVVGATSSTLARILKTCWTFDYSCSTTSSHSASESIRVRSGERRCGTAPCDADSAHSSVDCTTNQHRYQAQLGPCYDVRNGAAGPTECRSWAVEQQFVVHYAPSRPSVDDCPHNCCCSGYLHLQRPIAAALVPYPQLGVWLAQLTHILCSRSCTIIAS